MIYEKYVKNSDLLSKYTPTVIDDNQSKSKNNHEKHSNIKTNIIYYYKLNF